MLGLSRQLVIFTLTGKKNGMIKSCTDCSPLTEITTGQYVCTDVHTAAPSMRSCGMVMVAFTMPC